MILQFLQLLPLEDAVKSQPKSQNLFLMEFQDVLILVSLSVLSGHLGQEKQLY
jgi:hypothetical protein